MLFSIFVVAIGILIGILYYQFLDNDIQNNIINTLNNFNSFRYNAIVKDLVIMSLILVSSFFIIGIFMGVFYLFYESFTIGFLINIFFATYKIKGLLFIILYILINKFLTIILIIFFIRKIINISRLIIGMIIYRKDNVVKLKLIKNFKNSLYVIVFTLIINTILYFISPSINSYLSIFLK